MFLTFIELLIDNFNLFMFLSCLIPFMKYVFVSVNYLNLSRLQIKLCTFESQINIWGIETQR